MLRIRSRLILALLLTTSLLTLLMYSVGFAASPRQETPPVQEDGQEYVVKAGDWLSKISQEFLGSPSAYPIIVDATNAKAETDPRFTRITDPNVIRVGQRLWIPNNPDQPVPAITPTVVMSDSTAGAVDSGEVITPGVRFVTPEDGAVVSPTFDVEMAAEGLTIEPAGEIHEGAGHFHIQVDTDFVAPGELVPFDEHHVHFGQGQLTTTLELTPGVHVLRLQVANGAHIALEGAQYQDTITVTVASEQAVLPGVRSVARAVDGA